MCSCEKYNGMGEGSSGKGESRENTGIILGSIGAGLGSGLSFAGSALLGGGSDDSDTSDSSSSSMLSNPLVLGGIAAGGLGVAYLLFRR